MPESPEEKAALEKLDEETRQVAFQELYKEADREASMRRISGSGLWRGQIGPASASKTAGRENGQRTRRTGR